MALQRHPYPVQCFALRLTKLRGLHFGDLHFGDIENSTGIFVWGLHNRKKIGFNINDADIEFRSNIHISKCRPDKCLSFLFGCCIRCIHVQKNSAGAIKCEIRARRVVDVTQTLSLMPLQSRPLPVPLARKSTSEGTPLPTPVRSSWQVTVVSTVASNAAHRSA